MATDTQHGLKQDYEAWLEGKIAEHGEDGSTLQYISDQYGITRKELAEMMANFTTSIILGDLSGAVGILALGIFLEERHRVECHGEHEVPATAQGVGAQSSII